MQAASSTDGSTWTTVATTIVALKTRYAFGLAVTSHDTSQLNTADSVSATF